MGAVQCFGPGESIGFSRLSQTLILSRLLIGLGNLRLVNSNHGTKEYKII